MADDYGAGKGGAFLTASDVFLHLSKFAPVVATEL
jgi:hypothetical protein